MSLRLIPTEEPATSAHNAVAKNKSKKNFNPGSKLTKETASHDVGLKAICLRLVHFVNRGSRYSYEQVDEIIGGLHQSILGLQKKKLELLKKRTSKKRRDR